MKKSLALLVISIITSGNVQSQTSVYHPFPDSNATWCCSALASVSSDCYYEYSTYTMWDKQMINNTWYNKILIYDSSAHWECLPPNYLGSTITTDTLFIRQDSSLKKVWIYDSVSSSDKILYDFNLSVGDTLDTAKVYFANYGFTAPKIITSIDSVLINGTYRNRYNYNNGCNAFPTDTSIIEGIGALHGFIYPPSCFEFYFFLKAFHQNNTLYYGDSTAQCYDFTTGIAEAVDKLNISIFPNPTKDELTITFFQFQTGELEIYNSVGEKICTQHITASNKLQTSNWHEGIYFIRITTGEKIVTGKFVVSH